jgi:hypothetical protein
MKDKPEYDPKKNYLDLYWSKYFENERQLEAICEAAQERYELVK